MSKSHWIAVDFDWTLWNTLEQIPMPGAADAIDEFHSRGWRVLVLSCNQPTFIRKCCEEHNLRVDAIWGESKIDEGAKPDCSVFIDDRGFHFDGNWAECLPRIIEQVLDREANPKSRPRKEE